MGSHLLSKMGDQESVPSFGEGDICPRGASPAQSALAALLSGNSSPHSGRSQLGTREAPVLDLSWRGGRLCAPHLCSTLGEGDAFVRAPLPGPPQGPDRFLVPYGWGKAPESGAKKGVWVSQGAQSPLGVGGGRVGTTAPCWRSPSDWVPHLCLRAVEPHPFAVLLRGPRFLGCVWATVRGAVGA